MSDRRWPLIAARCGPTVARRASHVRFLSISSQLLRPVHRRPPKHISERTNCDPKPGVQALRLRLANAPARTRRLGSWSRRLASPLLRPDNRHSLTRGRPASSSYATASIPEARSRNSRVRKVGHAGSSIRPDTACSSAFPGQRPSVSRRDPRRRSAAMSVARP
jgi:hypothetical protein